MNRSYPHPIIAREGWPFIGGGLFLAIAFSCCDSWLAWPFWIFTVFALQFFRDPERPMPSNPDAVLSPVDGRVVVVERAQDPYRQTEALKISVFMNVFNVHSQKSPMSGKVTAVQYNQGKFMNADLDKASTENERNAVLMTTENGREITFVQIAGLVARRILCYTRTGETLARGERYGFIRFGSRVDLYLPLDAQPKVAIGDKVTGVSTVLAILPLQAEQTAPVVETPVATPVEEAAETVAPAAAVVASEAPAAAQEVGQQDIETAAEKVRQAVEKEFKA